MKSKMVAALSLGVLLGMVVWSSLRQSEAQGQVQRLRQLWDYKVVAFVVDDSTIAMSQCMKRKSTRSLPRDGNTLGFCCAGPDPYHTGQPGWVNSGGNVLFKRPKLLSPQKE